MDMKYTPEKIKELAAAGFFNSVPSAACVAIMPFVKPEHIGLEIGVFKGDSSIEFLENCTYMYFIDPCMEYAENPDKNWFTPEEEYLEKIQSYVGKFTFIKGFSADVAPQIEPGLDFVFIDANHEYDFVTQDIALYWPKIKPGGFLCGHDYGGGHPGVIAAVDDFFMPLGLCIEKHQYCWLVWKP
jgi:Methyltransferase domain